MELLKESTFKPIIYILFIIYLSSEILTLYFIGEIYHFLDKVGIYSQLGKVAILIFIYLLLRFPLGFILNDQYKKLNQYSKDMKISYERYQTLFRNPLNIVYIVNMDGVVVDINSATTTILGYLPKEVIGQHFNMFLESQRKDIRNKFHNENLQIDSESFIAKERIKHKNGKIIDMEVLSIPYTDEKGDIVGLIGVAKDITKESNYSKKLEDLSQRYKCLFEKNPHYACMFNKDGFVEEVNNKMIEDFGTNMIGSHYIDLLSKNDLHRALHDFESVRNGEVIQGIYQVVDKKGMHLKVDLKSIPIFVNNHLEGKFVIARDITEKDRLEQVINSDLDLAKVLQESVLSKPIRDKNIHISGHYIAAKHIGGDMYAWYKLDENRFGIIILDVMGHGVSSALISMSIRSLLEGIITKTKEPELVIQRLNQHMYQLFTKNIDSIRFFTALYLVVDTQKKEIEYVNAGHPSGIVISKNNILLESTCTPLGILENQKPKVKKLPYESGSKILLFTDGFLEYYHDLSINEAILEVASTYKGNQHLTSEELVLEALKNGEVTKGQDDVSFVKIEL
ncbi:SpoIIE family protein phosphatase [Bacillus sp. 31A1R]|uniref:SpoIIE family protein phosphatase n=1 Tax=Robertmurraya mangrovi TaxID=3098077 RepID=A0ABU5J3Z1_9BACI|nr:SpoIIE family protein phosphatase [Bacillus sp. 31A1R]MDZ5474113.1 SpoIIE family protein phosphatase [Bacillus sp. 31A1R]